MRYDGAEVRERLAAEYVLGTMPRLTRRRFARLVASDPSLARLVADWTERLAPIDAMTEPVAPPAQIRAAIQRHLSADTRADTRNETLRWQWLTSLALWRNAALAAATAAAALILYIAFSPAPPAPVVVAILSDSNGTPSWVAVRGPRSDEVTVSAVRPIADDLTHSLELWAIAGGVPRPLGLLHPQPTRPASLQMAQLPSHDETLAVSIEPPNGSPTGLPTGPVVYKGDVLISSP
jgi:anti-sigma-K factor RskA